MGVHSLGFLGIVTITTVLLIANLPPTLCVDTGDLLCNNPACNRQFKHCKEIKDLDSHCICYRTFHRCMKNIPIKCFDNYLIYITTIKANKFMMENLSCRMKGLYFNDTSTGSRKRAPLLSCLDPPPTHATTPPTSALGGTSDGRLPVVQPTRLCQVRSTSASPFTVRPYSGGRARTAPGVKGGPDFQGAWPMLEGPLFTVQLTASKPANSKRSVITQVTVILRRYIDCSDHTQFTIYSASNGRLPLKFQRGKSSSRGVRVKALGRRSPLGVYGVLLTAAHANLSLVIRRLPRSPAGRGYAVTAAAPTTWGFDASALCHALPYCLPADPLRGTGEEQDGLTETDSNRQEIDDAAVGMPTEDRREQSNSRRCNPTIDMPSSSSSAAASPSLTKPYLARLRNTLCAFLAMALAAIT